MRLWQILLLYPLICYGFGYLTARIYSKLKYKNLNKIITDFQKSNNKENNHVGKNH